MSNTLNFDPVFIEQLGELGLDTLELILQQEIVVGFESGSLFTQCLGGCLCRFAAQNCQHSVVIQSPTLLHAKEICIPDLRAGFAYVLKEENYLLCIADSDLPTSFHLHLQLRWKH